MASESNVAVGKTEGPGDQLEFEALSAVVQALQKLAPEGRARVLAAVEAFLGVSVQSQRVHLAPSASVAHEAPHRTSQFSEDRTPTPKEFLLEKRPQMDIERIACLAYYLTHYRETPHFKTLDLSKLNTDAAQVKFSNAAQAVDNASRAGLLVQATKGMKQISALGELYVQALPDRTAAKDAVAHARPRKKIRKAGKLGNGVDRGQKQ